MIPEANWTDDAACATTAPDLFFPESGDRWAAENAKKVCGTCPVIDICREVSVDEQHGIWAGTTPKEREARRAGREAA